MNMVLNVLLYFQIFSERGFRITKLAMQGRQYNGQKKRKTDKQ
jgi:hypothetical protein